MNNIFLFKKKKNLNVFLFFFFFFFIFFSLNLINASEWGYGNVNGNAIQTMFSQKVNTCISIPQICSNCSYVNLSSIKLPDSSVLLLNKIMEKNGVNFNYTFCNTAYLGSYIVTTCGDKDGIFTCASYDFAVTPVGGAENNTTSFIILVIFAIVLLLLAFIFKNYIFSFLSGLAISISGMYGMIYGFGNITNVYTQMVSLIIIGLGLIITIISALELIAEIEGLSGNSFGSYMGGDDD
jgi:hypothetical protein